MTDDRTQPIPPQTDTDLPLGWACVEFGECVEILDNQRIPINAGERSQRTEGKPTSALYPYFGATGQVGWIDDFIFDGEIVLLGEDGAPFLDSTKDKAYIVRGKSWVNNHAHVLRGKSELLHNSYLYHYLNQVDYSDFVTGTTRLKLNQSRMKVIPVKLAPLPEQRRIVEAIETQFTRLDAAVAGLERLRTNLNRYRQSVLKAACEGRLVPTEAALAQADGRSYEPASVLIKHVAQLRSQALQQGYPNDSEAKTQQNKQKKQIVPENLPEIPDGWTWATLMQCSLILVDCHNKTAPYTDSGVVLLRTSNIRGGKLLLDDVKYITEETFERWAARVVPQAGDILITREAPMGEVCIIPNGIQVCMGQRMMLIRVVPETIMREFLLYSLQDPDLMERVQDKPVGVTVQHLRVGGVETLLVPLPPLAEQQRIVEEVERRLSVVAQHERVIVASLRRAARLRQAILKRAFSGRLV